MIAAAQTNGGKLRSVHKEFEDGYLFAVLQDGDYVPVTFDVQDALGTLNRVVIAGGVVYHNFLMRRDGGWLVNDDSVIPTFSFYELEKIVSGITKGPDGQVYERYGYGVYQAEDTALCDVKINRVSARRLDAPFWDPGHVTQNATGQPDLFGFTQTDPRSCVHGGDGCNKCNDDSWESRLEQHRIDMEERK